MLTIKLVLTLNSNNCSVRSEVIDENGIEHVNILQIPFSLENDLFFFNGIENVDIKKQRLSYEKVKKRLIKSAQFLETELNKIPCGYSLFCKKYNEILNLVPSIVAVSLLGKEEVINKYKTDLQNKHNIVPLSSLIEQLFNQ